MINMVSVPFSATFLVTLSCFCVWRACLLHLLCLLSFLFTGLRWRWAIWPSFPAEQWDGPSSPHHVHQPATGSQGMSPLGFSTSLLQLQGQLLLLTRWLDQWIIVRSMEWRRNVNLDDSHWLFDRWIHFYSVYIVYVYLVFSNCHLLYFINRMAISSTNRPRRNCRTVFNWPVSVTSPLRRSRLCSAPSERSLRHTPSSTDPLWRTWRRSSVLD